ncbi:MAG: VWA domain-containing protein, partial [Bdellovibrionales bacterium]|nr:VWA domain-containing protein [Bdellovibrionales bacterium]
MRNVSLLSLLLFVSLACSDDAVRKLDESVRGKVKKQDKIKDVKLTFQPMVDILFVIDNSGSMGNHQANLARNVVSFTSSIVNNVLLDYHIGVVTSDMTTHAGELQGNPLWVERNTPNAKQVLANNLQPGTSGDYLEKFFEPLIAALYPPLVDSVNKGFY